MEKVLVISNDLLSNNTEQDIFKLIRLHAFFKERSLAEQNESIKQIIPYVILHNNNNYFLTQRLKESSEKRLIGLMSLGLGGHINEVDTSDSPLINCIKRELKEEVGLNITNPQSLNFLGVINSDKTEVGKFHIGVVYILNVHEQVEVCEKGKLQGHWVDEKEIKNNYNKLEDWSKIVYDNYIKTTL